MSIEKDLGKNLSTRADRDEAVHILRTGYGAAVRKSDASFQDLYHQLVIKAREEAGPPDWLEFREVEGRGVLTVWPKTGHGHCWVWSGRAWREVPGLLAKASLEGRRLPDPLRPEA